MNGEDVMQRILDKWYIIEWYGDTVKQTARKNYKAEKERKRKLIYTAGGWVKGIPARQEKKEWNDGLIPRAKPFFTAKEGEAPNAGKMIANSLPSLRNVVADIGNMGLNPYDTAKWLVDMAGWAAINLWQRWAKKITGISDEEINARMNRIAKMNTPLWAVARKMREMEMSANDVWGALGERYGGVDKVAKTMTEDPVGMISDILWIAEWGASFVKTSAKATKVGALAKVADKAGDVAKLANKADPYNMAIRWWQWAVKATTKGVKNTVQWAQKMVWSGLDWLNEEIKGIDSNTVKQIQSNPYVNEYWEKIEEQVRINGVQSKWSELIQPLLEDTSSRLIDEIETMRASLSDSWPLYNEIRKLKVDIDTTAIDSNLNEVLDKYNIKVWEDGKLNFTQSKFVQSSDMSSIQSIYDRIQNNVWQWMGTNEIINLRQAADSASSWEWVPTKSKDVIKEMRSVVDETAKEQVPQLRKLDNLYSSEIKALDELEEGLVYRDKRRKGQFRGNIQQTMNTLNKPNRAQMKKRLMAVMPDLPERIAAITMMPTIAKAYTGTPSLSAKVTSAWMVWVPSFIWGHVGWIAWAIWWAIVGYIGDSVFKKLRQDQLQAILSEISPEAQKRLIEINEAIEWGLDLRQSEFEILDSIRAKLEEEIQGTQTN